MERIVDTPLLHGRPQTAWSVGIAFVVMVVLFSVAPFFAYPVFLMEVLCFALFACAFNLLIGYVGLVSFGHALYFGWAGYLSAYAAKAWALPPEKLRPSTTRVAGTPRIASAYQRQLTRHFHSRLPHSRSPARPLAMAVTMSADVMGPR